MGFIAITFFTGRSYFGLSVEVAFTTDRRPIVNSNPYVSRMMTNRKPFPGLVFPPSHGQFRTIF